MSHETVKIAGSLKDQAAELLGGKNVTPARMAALLEELAQLRAITGVTPEPEAAAPPEPEPVTAAERPPGDDDDDDDKDPEFEDLVNEPAKRAELPVFTDPRDAAMAAMAKLIEGLTLKVEQLNRPATEKDKAEAREAGLLPPSIQAPPLGFTGPASWPRGKWFPSPLGPRGLEAKLCPCATCAGGTQHHWYCVICKGGPFHYATPCKEHHEGARHPFFTKSHFGAGQVWGISHACCSKPCMDDYLGRLGVIAGVNDHEGPRSPMQTMEPAGAPGTDAEPQRPLVATTSD